MYLRMEKRTMRPPRKRPRAMKMRMSVEPLAAMMDWEPSLLVVVAAGELDVVVDMAELDMQEMS